MILSLISAVAAFANPAPFPIFLKAGFSVVLEFESAPKKLVVGDSQSFQVERMDKSLVVRALVNEASSNLFVYFGSAEPRLFVLTASDDAEPTIYKKFESSSVLPAQRTMASASKESNPKKTGVRSAVFSKKRDFLTLEVLIVAGTKAPIRPDWESTAILYKGRKISPEKMWAERKEVHRDSQVKARFVFRKPDLPKDLALAELEIPQAEEKPLVFKLGRN